MIWPPVKLLQKLFHLLTLVPTSTLNTVLVIHLENIQSSNAIEIYCKSCKRCGILWNWWKRCWWTARSTCKVTNIQEDLRAEPGNKWKQENQSEWWWHQCKLKREIIWFQRMKRALGKLDKALQHFCKYGPTTK